MIWIFLFNSFNKQFFYFLIRFSDKVNTISLSFYCFFQFDSRFDNLENFFYIKNYIRYTQLLINVTKILHNELGIIYKHYINYTFILNSSSHRIFCEKRS